MRLFMIRHGQTPANAGRYFYNDNTVSLTEKGRQQAMSIRPILEGIHFDKVYSSDYIRAIETQQLALPEAEAVRLPLLREIDPGQLAGKSYDYVKENPQIFGNWTPSCDEQAYGRVGGESLEQVGKRLRSFMEMLEADPCENVAAFVHNGVIGAMLRLVLGAKEFNRSNATSSNCAVHVFEFDGKKWKLLAWNYGIKL